MILETDKLKNQQTNFMPKSDPVLFESPIGGIDQPIRWSGW